MNGNRWSEKTIKKIQSQRSFSKKQLKTLIYDAMTYYLIGTITLQTFLEIVNTIGKRSEIPMFPKIKEVINLLKSLSKHGGTPEIHQKKIIDVFHKVVTTPLT